MLMIGEDISILKKMKLHESMELEQDGNQDSIIVLRVFNGWIYSIPTGEIIILETNVNDRTCIIYNHVFVPEK